MEVKAFVPGGQISTVVLLVMGTFACFRALFGTGPIDEERMFASLSLYLLFGLIFALIFAVIEEFLPGSFHYPDTLSPDTGTRPLSQLFYFSFVTLATLGYGDIVPISGPAKGMAILEAVIGQMYLVVVVARLVSLYGQSEKIKIFDPIASEVYRPSPKGRRGSSCETLSILHYCDFNSL